MTKSATFPGSGSVRATGKLLLIAALAILPGAAAHADGRADADKCAELSASETNGMAAAFSDETTASFFAAQAVGYCTRAIESGELDPEQLANTHVLRGLWVRNKASERAIADYDAALKLNPEDAEAYTLRGTTRLQKGDLEPALADFDQAIRLRPEESHAYFNRGVARAQQGNLDQAIADFDAVLRLEPEHAQAHFNRGITWEQKDDLDRALADYDAAIRLDPRNALAYFNRGSAWRKKGDIARANADFDAATRFSPRGMAGPLREPDGSR